MTNYRSVVNFRKTEEIERMLYLFFYALISVNEYFSGKRNNKRAFLVSLLFLCPDDRFRYSHLSLLQKR